MHLTHINRLLIVFSILTAMLPIVAVSLLVHGAHVLAGAVIWWAF